MQYSCRADACANDKNASQNNIGIRGNENLYSIGFTWCNFGEHVTYTSAQYEEIKQYQGERGRHSSRADACPQQSKPQQGSGDPEQTGFERDDQVGINRMWNVSKEK